MKQPETRKPHIRLRDLVTGELVSRGLHAVVDLRVPDLLAGGAKSTVVLAEEVGCHEPSLYRLLRFLASFGIFNETQQRQFALTEVGTLLREGPHTLRSFVRMFASPWNQGPFSALGSSVRTGRSAFVASMGHELFDYLEQNPDAATLFNTVMGDFLEPVHRAVASAYDFSNSKLVVDVGGGRGYLLTKILERNKQAHGILFDTPTVVDEAKHLLAQQADHDRVECIAGSFFESVPPGGNIYLLCRVLHDWDDTHAVQILTTIRQAMTSTSRLLIVEQLMPPGDDPSFVKTTDMWMMLMFHEGRERTEKEMRQLLQAANLHLLRIVATDVNDVVIEALPL